MLGLKQASRENISMQLDLGCVHCMQTMLVNTAHFTYIYYTK